MMLFTDGSVHVQTGIGFGAYLIIDDVESPIDLLKNKVKIVRFEQTSSTKLELQTLLHAFENLPKSVEQLQIYSDSQNIQSLLERRERLEKNDFISKSGRLLNNSDLYREFFQKTDDLNCTFFKVKGHKKSVKKNKIDRIFTLVDRASRKALREHLDRT